MKKRIFSITLVFCILWGLVIGCKTEALFENRQGKSSLFVNTVTNVSKKVTGRAGIGNIIEITTQVNIPKEGQSGKEQGIAVQELVASGLVDGEGKFEVILPNTYKDWVFLNVIQKDTLGAIVNTKEVVVKYAKPVAVGTKKATATHYWEGYSASNLVDENIKTRWSSKRAIKTPSIEIEFQNEETLDTLMIEEFANRVNGFRVYSWEKESWKLIYEGTTMGSNAIITIPRITTRKIKLDITSVIDQEPSIYEIQTLDSTQVFKQPTLTDDELIEELTHRLFTYHWEIQNSDKNSPGYGLASNTPPENIVNCANMGFILNSLIIRCRKRV